MCRTCRHKTLRRTCVVNFNLARRPRPIRPQTFPYPKPQPQPFGGHEGGHARVLVTFFQQKIRAAEKLASTGKTRNLHKVLCRPVLHVEQHPSVASGKHFEWGHCGPLTDNRQGNLHTKTSRDVDNIYFEVHTFLSPNAERRPSRMLAHSGARHQISGLPEIYGAERGDSVGSSGGPSLRPSRDVCAEPLRLEVLWKLEAFPLRGLGPPRTERVWGVASVARSGPGELLLAVICFRFGRTRVCKTPISLHRVKIILLGGKNCSKQSCSLVSSIYYIKELIWVVPRAER